jgi:8-oxo-dGTP pyrophosphatase MutT (NUDIX family)
VSEAVENGTIVRLSRVDARVEPYAWGFAQDNAEGIDRHWASISHGKPAMFNGRVMLQHRAAIRDGVFEAGYFETDYAAFMTWRDAGHPGPVIRNGFAMAALRANDGAFLCGRMGDHTANAGKVYFAAGTPDREDVRPDGRLDLAGSVTRELGEETGLRVEELSLGEGWTAVIEQGRVAFMREVGIDMAAEAARALMLRRMQDLEEEELSDIVIVRSVAEAEKLDMPPFMRRYLAHIFDGD